MSYDGLTAETVAFRGHNGDQGEAYHARPVRAGEFPGMAEYERSMSSALNADYARMDAEVHDGDEIAFLPPVSGG